MFAAQAWGINFAANHAHNCSGKEFLEILQPCHVLLLFTGMKNVDQAEIEGKSIPLKFKNPEYPLYKRGNPQLRVFLPNFWMKIIKPKEPIPPYMVLFQTSVEMTEYDVKNYLQKIYNIPIVEVKLTIKQGLIRKAYGEQYLVKEDDFKEALITMPRKYKFTYPELVAKTESEDKQKISDLKKYKPSLKPMEQLGIPTWFC